MSNTFAFIGHELVEAHVASKLGAIGWRQVSDVAQASAAFTYCMGTSMLEDAYFDDGGLVKNAEPHTLLIDLSPSTPSFSREVSAVATVNDLTFVEAPLSIDDPLGPLSFTCFASCEEPRGIDSARPLLEAIASSIEETGAVGSAQLAKAARTVEMTARTIGAVESQALVRSAREVGCIDAASSADDDFTKGFPIELALADVVAAMTSADDVELILPQLEAAMHLLELMVVIGGADLNLKSLSLLYREEEASAAHGLDWARAEGLYAEHGHDHDHDHGLGHSCDRAEGFDGYGLDDDFGFAGGFGGYSAN